MSQLLYTEEESELRASVRALLADRSGPAAVLGRIETDQPYDSALWKALAEQTGCAGLPISEEHGGAGASFRETAVVLEELGRSVAPTPFFGSAVLATAALLAAGETELLTELAGGAISATLAVPFSFFNNAFPTTVSADLTGTVTSVVDALTADYFVVPAQGPALYVVAAADVELSPIVTLDPTRPLANVTLKGASGRQIASGDDAVRALTAAWRTGAALLASEQLGVAERALETTIEYLKTRYQFGRPLGSFQALKHRLADAWVSVTQARAVARYAATCVATDDPDADIAASLAQAQVSQAALTVAEEAVQLHGGIGFTWEHPAHLYLKRAKSTSLALGTADRHRARLATLVDLTL
jgi:alkylation response protein AidB-like acyl-CoA dehydrogenase